MEKTNPAICRTSYLIWRLFHVLYSSQGNKLLLSFALQVLSLRSERARWCDIFGFERDVLSLEAERCIILLSHFYIRIQGSGLLKLIFWSNYISIIALLPWQYIEPSNSGHITPSSKVIVLGFRHFYTQLWLWHLAKTMLPISLLDYICMLPSYTMNCWNTENIMLNLSWTTWFWVKFCTQQSRLVPVMLWLVSMIRLKVAHVRSQGD